MLLQDKITEDWKSAFKARSPDKDVLSLIRTEMLSKAKDSKKDKIEDPDAFKVLNKMAKQREDVISQLQGKNREDIVEKERKELKVITSYLPKKLSLEETRELVSKIIEETGASSMKDMGSVIKGVMKNSNGLVDGSLVQKLIKDILEK